MPLIDSYSETLKDSASNLQDEHPSDAAGKNSASAQAITLTRSYQLTSAKFYLTKTSAPTSDLRVLVYACSGTVGTDAVGFGSALAISDAVNAATLNASPTYALHTFTFTDTNKIILSEGSSYVFALVAYSTGVDDANYVSVGAHSAGTHSGNTLNYANGSWTANAAVDTIFYVYGDAINNSFNDIKAQFKKRCGGSFTVTLKPLVLGSQDATTGWHSLTYTSETSMELVIVAKGQAFMAFPLGAYTRYNYTGYTTRKLFLYDKIEDSVGHEYRVLGCLDYWMGDSFAFYVVELEKIMET